MFRVQAAAATRAAAATLTSSSSSSSRASLHTTSVLSAESARKRQARLTRQKNLAKREELQKKAAAARPHVILGTVAHNEDEADAKWAACDLAKVLVHPEELAPDAPAEAQEVDGVRVQPLMAFGMRGREERMLFEHLPMLTADMSTRHRMMMPRAGVGAGGTNNANANANDRLKGMDAISAYHDTQLAAGVVQANKMARVVDLRNANAAGVAFENRRRIIEAFSEPGKPNDSGRTEVQVALLTLQVRNVWNHLRAFKRDVASRRSLRRLVHQRAKLLKYLKRTDRDRYERILERLGLEPGAVEGELVI